jgi:hypothetical protein
MDFSALSAVSAVKMHFAQFETDRSDVTKTATDKNIWIDSENHPLIAVIFTSS